MSTQERIDVILRAVSGPLSRQGEVVCRGPTVKIGANPGPGGLMLQGYRGLDSLQATITSYDGGKVAITPVGQNQVRMSPTENVDWREIPAIRKPVYLSPGEAFHLGPPDRGATFIYIDSRNLGAWSQGRIFSEAAQGAGVHPSHDPTRQIVRRSMPAWFMPGMLGSLLITMSAVGVLAISRRFEKPPLLGVVDDGYETMDIMEDIDQTVVVNESLLDGFEAPFREIVMIPNAAAADWPELLESPSQWDQRLIEKMTQSAKAHGQGRRFWMRLEEITDDYAYVLDEVRAEGLPEVIASIPYWESGYRSDRTSWACAKGYWQMMPEYAQRLEVPVAGCRLRGSEETWSPTELVVPATRHAVYIDQDRRQTRQANACRIQSCRIDQRGDLQTSTRGALVALREAWQDPTIRDSGAAVQLTILSHHAGFDDQRINGKKKGVNVLPAYRRYLKANGKQRSPNMVGNSITCKTGGGSDRCGSVLDPDTQHYAYHIIAIHALAMCYYGSNYDDIQVYEPWREHTIGDGYCTRIEVPSAATVRTWLGGA